MLPTTILAGFVLGLLPWSWRFPAQCVVVLAWPIALLESGTAGPSDLET